MTKKKKETRAAQVLNIQTPIAMTLAKTPANRTGFKVVRSDGDTAEAEQMTATHHKRKRTKKTLKRDESLYMIRLPDGISQSDAETLRDAFGMTDDYDVVQTEDGSYWLSRKNIANMDEIMATDGATMTFDMGNGFHAVFDAEAFARTDKRPEGEHGVKLVEIQMEGFELKAAKDWLESNGVDFMDGGIEQIGDQGEESVIVKRHEYHEADVRKVRIEDGVTGLVVRADENDVPVHLYRAVLEESYGYYGYGMLDFAQYLASPYYTDATWDGIYALREVLENVTLYSGLPLDERAALVDNAPAQFGDYFKNLIAAMPREAVQAAQRFDKQTQEAEMAKKDKTDDKVEQRTDDQAAEEQKKLDAAKAAESTEQRTDGEADAGDTADAKDDASTKVETRAEGEVAVVGADNTPYVTKDELTAAVTEAVTAVLQKRDDEQKAALDAAKADDAEGDAEKRTDDAKPSAADEKLAEGVTTLADATAKLMGRMDELDRKLDSYGENVETRSEEDGGASAPAGDTAGADPFAGMMGALNGLRQE